MTTIDLKAESLERVACKLALARLADLLPAGLKPGDIFDRFLALCRDQQRRLDNHQPTSPIPLHMLASLEHLGFRVELETGRVTGWPVRGMPEVKA